MALALLPSLVSVDHGLVAQGRSADTAAVRRALTRVFDTTSGDEPFPAFAKQLPEVESGVVSLLNARESLTDVNGWLSSLPGFKGPHSGKSTTIGNAVFFSDLAKDGPSYFISALTPARPDIALLLVTYPWVNGPSRLSLLRRGARHWSVLAAIPSGNQLEVCPLQRRSPTPVLAIFDRRWRADGSEGHLQLWRLEDQRLRQMPLVLPLLQDAAIENADSQVVISTLQFPDHIKGCVMCTRLAVEFAVRPDGDRAVVNTRQLNPWVAVVNRFYGYVDLKQRDSATTLLVNDTLFSVLAGPGAEAEADTGDVAKGYGEVEIHLASDSVETPYLRVLSHPGPDGSWRIIGVIRGRWVSNHLEWEDGRKDKY